MTHRPSVIHHLMPFWAHFLLFPSSVPSAKLTSSLFLEQASRLRRLSPWIIICLQVFTPKSPSQGALPSLSKIFASCPHAYPAILFIFLRIRLCHHLTYFTYLSCLFFVFPSDYKLLEVRIGFLSVLFTVSPVPVT